MQADPLFLTFIDWLLWLGRKGLGSGWMEMVVVSECPTAVL